MRKDVKRLKRTYCCRYTPAYLTISYRESVLDWSGHILDFGAFGFWDPDCYGGGIEVSVRTLGGSSSLPCSSSVKQCMHFNALKCIEMH